MHQTPSNSTPLERFLSQTVSVRSLLCALALVALGFLIGRQSGGNRAETFGQMPLVAEASSAAPSRQALPMGALGEPEPAAGLRQPPGSAECFGFPEGAEVDSARSRPLAPRQRPARSL